MVDAHSRQQNVSAMAGFGVLITFVFFIYIVSRDRAQLVGHCRNTHVVAHALDRLFFDKMKKPKSILGLLTIVLLLTSCKSYYNDTIDWMDNIKIGTTLDEVKKSRPDFIEIDWNKPDSVGNQVRFMVTKIKGNNDVLEMSHTLVFVDNKFQGRESHK